MKEKQTKQTKPANKFSERLKELRILSKMSQDEIAKEFYVSRSCWTNYERGYRSPSLETVYKIAEFFDIDIKYLIGADEFGKDTEEFVENKMNIAKYLNKHAQLDLSTLSTLSKVIIVELYKFFLNKGSSKTAETPKRKKIKKNQKKVLTI